MEIFVRADESGNATQVRGYVEYRMFSAVSRFARQCDRQNVRLGQDDALQTREQYSCSVVLDLAPAGRVRVRATGDRLYAAIDRAAKRLSHGVEQRLGSTARASGHGVLAATDDIGRES
jgi:ribosome-associated translation inhibitor RaiA